jgi:hypothetical protein
MTATPYNTAVVCLLNYKEGEIPATCAFFQKSAARLGISPMVFGRGDTFGSNTLTPDHPEFLYHNSFNAKVTRLAKHIATIPPEFKYILYVDARDSLFVRSLWAICDEFNRTGWPLLFGAGPINHPHVDPGWLGRFRQNKTGIKFLNAGVWMAERGALEEAFDKLEVVSSMVKENEIPSSASFLHDNDQHVWQAAYAEEMLPIRLDFERQIFMNMDHSDISDFDFSKSTEDAPVVLKNGSRPSIIHFPGISSVALPFFAWFLRIAPLP